MKNFSLQSLLGRKTVESEAAQFGRDARADWRIVSAFFLFLLVAAIVVNVVVYSRINKGEIFLVDKKEHVSPRSFDRFGLESTVSFFERRHERFDTLKQKGFSAADPFIPAMGTKR